MRIATWNVNSVRARMASLVPWVERQQPDVLCLQELKCTEEHLPRDDLEALGYNVEAYGQKTYNGVAILSKQPMEDVVKGFPDDGGEARALGATIGDVLVLNLYVVNGKEVGDVKYEKKLAWLAALHQHVQERYDVSEKVVICGDMNITFDDRDIYDPEKWHEKILCSTPEREALGRIMSLGYTDAFRRFHEEGGLYTWWDFRTRGFPANRGLRIDHFLLSDPAMAACTDVEIDTKPRGGERPSDHAPVIATLD